MQLRGSAADPGQTEGLQTQGSQDGRMDCRPRAVGTDRRTAGPGQSGWTDGLQAQGSWT